MSASPYAFSHISQYLPWVRPLFGFFFASLLISYDFNYIEY